VELGDNRVQRDRLCPVKMTITNLALVSLLVASCNGRKGSSHVVENHQSASVIAMDATLCEIVGNPLRYDGKRVSVRGCITTDGREHIALSDSTWPCADGGLVPVESARLSPERQYHAAPNKKVCGTFIGTFRAATLVYQHVLEVDDTAALHDEPK